MKLKAFLRVRTTLANEHMSWINDCKLGQKYNTESHGFITVLERHEDQDFDRVYYTVDCPEALTWYTQESNEYAIIVVIPADVVTGPEHPNGKLYSERMYTRMYKDDLKAFAKLMQCSGCEFLEYQGFEIEYWLADDNNVKRFLT